MAATLAATTADGPATGRTGLVVVAGREYAGVMFRLMQGAAADNGQRLWGMLPLLLVTACGAGSSAGGHVPTPPVVVVAPGRSAQLVTAAVPKPPAKPCKVTTADDKPVWQRWKLQLAAGAKPWGTLRTPKGTPSVQLPAGNAPNTIGFHFVSEVVSLDSLVRTDTVKLYPREPLWFHEVVLASAFATLDWNSFDGDKLKVELNLGEDIQLTLQKPVPCAAITLSRNRYVASKLIDEDGFEPGEILGSGQLALRAKPDGEVKLTIALPDGYQVSRGPIEGARQRMVIHTNKAHIVAWVPRERLRPLSGAGDLGGLMGYGTGHGSRSITHSKRLTCNQRIKLDVAFEGQRRQVGWINANSNFAVPPLSARPHGMVEVYFPKASPVSLTRGAEWQVPSSVIKDCQPAS